MILIKKRVKRIENLYYLEAKVLLSAMKCCHTGNCDDCPFLEKYCDLISVADIDRIVEDIPNVQDLENLKDKNVGELIRDSELLMEGVNF